MHLTRGGSRNLFLAAGSLRSSASLLPATRLFIYNLLNITIRRAAIMIVHNRTSTIAPPLLDYCMHKNREEFLNLLTMYALKETKKKK